MKYSGINLAEYVQSLYAKNKKTLWKEIKDLNREIFCTYGSDVAKMPVFPLTG